MFRLKHSYYGIPAGTTVYTPRVDDFGLAKDTFLFTGIEAVTVTQDPSGGYPVFCVAANALEEYDEEVQ